MRGRSSSAKTRLRSAGYKCNLCGRKVIDAATLVRHQKTIHNVSPREHKLNPKPKPVQKKLTTKEKNKIFDNLLKQEVVEAKPKRRNSKNNHEHDTPTEDVAGGGKIKSKKDDLITNGESITDQVKTKKKSKDGTRQIEFECPVCAKTFSVYFTAHKHIQKTHPVNVQGKKVSPTSPDLVQPIRVEQCYKCGAKMRSNEHHSCQVTEEIINVIAEFVCSGCNQIFVSLKSFDMHVAGLHSDSVDSMFFPTKIEFMNWRLEMERQTNANYSLYGEYESKKVYRCSYARNDSDVDKYTAYFCPSSMVVQEFSKGIQVHFYNKHYDHKANNYSLSSKYKKYSITSFLKNPNEETSTDAYTMKLDDKDLYSQFKKLMDSVVLNAADMDILVLKILIEKALEMSTVVTEATANKTLPALKKDKNMSDKEITEALGLKTVLHKRRKSVDSEIPPNPAKRLRRKSLYNQSEMSPKILNTFSLASNSNSEDFQSNHSDDNVRSYQGKKGETDVKKSKSTKMNTKLRSFYESISFNDSYKDFIDKNFIAKSDNTRESKLTRNTVKTKLGAFKQTSPRKVEKDDILYDINLRGMKPIAPVSSKVEDSPDNVDKSNPDSPKLTILSIESPNLAMSKTNTSKRDNHKETNSQINAPKVDTPKANMSKLKARAFSHVGDPGEVNRSDSSSPDSIRGNLSKTSRASPLVDPLELNPLKGRNKNTLSETPYKNTVRGNAPKQMMSAIDPLELDTPKAVSPKVYSGPKVNHLGMKSTKVSPKVSFKTKVTPYFSLVNKHTAYINRPQKTVKELKYEVREQENDCNILVLKF